MKIEKGEDSAFISEAADRLTPFGGPVKSKTFDESPALLARNVTSVSSVLSSSSEDDDCTRDSISSSLFQFLIRFLIHQYFLYFVWLEWF
jgi:hypothetical protein